jgi:hypothetical protein
MFATITLVGKSVRLLIFISRNIELEIKDTTDTDRFASYLDLHLDIDSEGQLRMKLYDKRDDFNFPIVNFPFITQTPLKIGGELRCSGKVSNSCSTSGTRRVNLVTNPVISRE